MNNLVVRKLSALSLSVALFSHHLFAKAIPASSMVLNESYLLSKYLKGKSLAFYLVRLTDISTTISPDRTESFSKQLRDLIPSLPKDPDRVASAKNALVPLSKVNPVLAFDLLAQVEPQIPPQEGFIEDVRADAAATIFLRYAEAIGVTEALPKILAEADAIGAPHGEYPYRAIGLVVRELWKAHASVDQLIAVFNRAVSFYHRSSGYLDENAEFFEFLQSTNQNVPGDAYQDAYQKGLREFVTHLTSAASQEPTGYRAVVNTSDGQYVLTSEKLLLLFKIFPTIASIDRSWANQLVQQNPILIHADPEMDAVPSVVQGNLEQVGAVTFNEEMQQNFLVVKIRHLQEVDPHAALREAQLLTNQNARLNALSTVVPGLMQVDPAEARLIYAELVDASANLPEGVARLQVLVGTAKAAHYVGDVNGFVDLTIRVFDSGLQLSNASLESEKVVTQRKGYRQLQEMTEFAAQYDPGSVLNRIRSVSDKGLRAYLLLYAAKGLKNAENGPH